MSLSPVKRVEAALERVVAQIDGGEERLGQQEMARAVAEALAGGRHLVVRAGTGTGKSLAYLVPALLSRQRVVVSTATKNLQDQLATKDLPDLGDRLGEPVEFAVLKGRSNYLCRQRLAESAELGEQGRLEPETAHSARSEQSRAIVAWAQTTVSGDRAELPFEPEDRVWASFSVTPDECPGVYRCPSGSTCCAEAARQRAADADVVVVNHHLLGAHLASGDVVLGEFDALVIDEAHELEEVLSRSLGTSLAPGRLRALGASVRAAVPGASSPELARAVEALFEVASGLEDVLGRRLDQRVVPAQDDELGTLLGLLGTRLVALEGSLGGPSGTEPTPAVARVQSVIARLREQVQGLLALDEGSVAWVEGGQRPTLEVAPIDVGALLSERLFGRVPVVLTSATIPPGLGARLGAAPESTDELDVGSPFAFEQHALLYCATHLPDPRATASSSAVHDELLALMEAAGGRTLGLFTSRRAMVDAATALRGRFGLPILLQGEAPKAALVESFREAPEASLFATMGFWQGVDVPGETCSLVVIDRIPFGRPDDPLLVARRAHAGPDAFRLVDLPRAAALLAQGAGRLIRRGDDRGVVAVLDPRLANASYRWSLIRALPPMRRTRDRAEVEGFLRDLRGATTVDP